MPSRRPRPSLGAVALSEREALLFEAGIKLGGIFHQYIGVPISPRTAPGLARSIEAAVALQPFVHRIRVRLRPARGARPGTGRFGYRYLTAEMLEATIELASGRTRVTARLAYEPSLRYPWMRVTGIRAARRGPQSGRSSMGT